MADPLSMSASIAGLVSLADTVFRHVYKFARTAAGAKEEVQTLAEEINTLSSVLRHLNALASELEAEGNAFEPALRAPHLALCQKTFANINKRVKKALDSYENKPKWEGIQRSLKWPFSASETRELLTTLSRHKDTLVLATSADTMHKLQLCLANQAAQGTKIDSIADNVEKAVQITSQIQLDSKTNMVLRFFLKPEYNPQPALSQSIKLRHPTTGGWLLESDIFRDWIETPGSKLWLNGIPGGGKTILSGAIIQEALSRCSPTVGAAFFFCDYKNEETLKLDNILAALASQLARQKDDAFELLQEYHTELHPKKGLNGVVDADELRALICRMSDKFEQVVIVIDGLDECGDSTHEVVEMMVELADLADTITLAIASRDEWEIRASLEGEFTEIIIAAHLEDLDLFVRAEMEQRIQAQRIKINNPTLADEIRDELVNRANGMFRWVVCQLDALCEVATDAGRRQALKELPHTLSESYRRLLERVNKRHLRTRKLVQMCLLFIVFFPHKLSMLELCQAVSTPDTIGASLDESNTVSEREIALACTSLIRKAEDANSFELAHFSVREFLQDESLTETPELQPYRLVKSTAYPLIAKQCVKFLMLKSLAVRKSLTMEEWSELKKERKKTMPFYAQAASTWPVLVDDGLHVPQLREAVMALFHPTRASWFRPWLYFLLFSFFCDYLNDDGDLEGNEEFGQPKVASNAEEYSFASFKLFDGQQLQVACAFGLPEVCSQLIAGGADVKTDLAASSREACYSSLDLASASWAHTSHLKDLQDKGLSALKLVKRYLPSSRRRCDTIECLVQAGATFLAKPQNPQSLFLTTCAIDCLFHDFGPTMGLLRHGVRPLPNDSSQFRDFLRSFEWGAGAMEFESSILDFLGYLKSSSAYDHSWGLEIGKILWSFSLDQGYIFTDDPDVTDYRISLSEDALIDKVIHEIACDNVDGTRVCLQDPRLSVKNLYQSWGVCKATLLHYALYRDKTRCAQLLLDMGSDPHQLDSLGNRAIHNCNFYGQGASFKLLAENGVPLISQNEKGQTVWHRMVDAGWNDEAAHALLALDTNANRTILSTRDIDGFTPLQYCLLPPSDDTFIKEDDALRLLSYANDIAGLWQQHGSIFPDAFKCSSVEVVRRLLSWGLLPDPLGPGEATPLHHLQPVASLEWVIMLDEIYPGAISRKYKGRFPVDLYLETCLKAGRSPEKNVVESLISVEVLADAGSPTIWDRACALRPYLHEHDEFDLLNEVWSMLIHFNIMTTHENHTGQCGLEPLFSAEISRKGLGLLKYEAEFPVSQTVREAIRLSTNWNPNDYYVVFFLKMSISRMNRCMVERLLHAGVSVHQRVDNITVIEHACSLPLVDRLSSTSDGRLLLDILIRRVDVDKLREISPGKHGISILHRGASSREPGLCWLIERLLKEGADINAVNAYGTGVYCLTPMTYHLLNGSVDCAKILLKMGADPMKCGQDTAIWNAGAVAVEVDNAEFLEELLAQSHVQEWEIDWKSYHAVVLELQGIEIEVFRFTSLHRACALGHLDCVKFFLRHRLMALDEVTTKGFTPLHLATLYKQTHVVEYLVSEGAFVDIRTEYGSTPLHLAVRTGYLKMTRCLVAMGARDIIDGNGMSARKHAYMAGYDHIVEFFNQTSFGTMQATDDAVILPERFQKMLQQLEGIIQEGKLDDCIQLAAQGCPLDASMPSCGICKPLVFAMYHEKVEIAAWLLENDANVLDTGCPEHLELSIPELASFYYSLNPLLPDILRRFHKVGGSLENGFDAPLHYAADEQNLEGLRSILTYLQQNSADFLDNSSAQDVAHAVLDRAIAFRNMTTGTPLTALHVASIRGNVEACKLLIEHGANIDSVVEGNHVIELTNSPDLIAFFLEKGACPATVVKRSPARLLRKWGPAAPEVAEVYSRYGLKDLCPWLSDVPTSSTPADEMFDNQETSFVDLPVILRLEKLGMNLENMHYQDRPLMVHLLEDPSAQAFFLNSTYDLENLEPFPWHWLTTWEMAASVPFLTITFRQFKRKLSPKAMKRWMNLQPSKGWSPLCRAASINNIKVIENCLSMDAELDFEGSPIGSALVVASACGCLEAVKVLTRAGASISYYGRAGFVNAVTLTRSIVVRQYLLSASFGPQLRIGATTAEDKAASPLISPLRSWSGIALAKMRIRGWHQRRRDESSLEWAIRLAYIRRSLLGKVASPIEEIVYACEKNY